MLETKDIMSGIYKTQGITALSQYSKQWLIKNGFIYNEVIGWEKISVINMFGLNPDMKAIPVEGFTRDEQTGFKVPKVANNYISYRNWKKRQRAIGYAQANKAPAPQGIVGIDF